MTTGWLQMLLMVITVIHIVEVPAVRHRGKLNMIQRYLVLFIGSSVLNVKPVCCGTVYYAVKFVFFDHDVYEMCKNLLADNLTFEI